MKKLEKGVLTAGAVALAMLGACSNKPKVNVVFDYEISDLSTSNKKVPDWIDYEYVIEKNNKDKEFKYYLGNNENLASKKTKLLCAKEAEAQARRGFAAAIASDITSTYKANESAEQTTGNVVSTSQEQMTLKIAQELNGIETYKKYWEERHHLVKLGAKNDYKDYACYSLLRLSKQSYRDLISTATDVMLQNVKMKAQEKTAMKEKIVNEVVEK